ncbi:SIR2 family protein [Iodidimonas sp. SYSU 1G8]|uniref:SIR2 family protein n=1 Tax=Iodidimonas sp. SYSU 1G8 TaxID=3133967 RepID=UPI0031FE8C25
MTTANTFESAEYQLIGPAEDGKISNLLADKSGKEARQRLQALISEWLRMENLVVLTGAGTSHSSGGMLMKDLETSVLETVAASPDIPTNSSRIIIARQAPPTAGGLKLGFEDWLSYLVNAAHLSSTASSPFSGVTWKEGPTPSSSELNWLTDRISKAIFLDCALSLCEGSGASQISPHLSFLAKLVSRDSNLGRSHIFTLNYDTLFEQAFELLGIQYFDGFTGRANARFDPSVYGLDIYWPGEVAEGRVRRFDKFVHFYKLHGSIHWHIDNSELRARHPNLQALKEFATLDVNAKAARLSEVAGFLNAVGILPTANKFAQTLTMPFAHLFRAFQIRLSAPQTFLLVMGYGFGDDHVTRVIETALMNPSLIMLVVEPDPTSPIIKRIERYKELGKRAFVLTATLESHKGNPFTRATFDDFATNVMPDVQWLDDFLRLRRFEKQISSSGDA